MILEDVPSSLDIQSGRVAWRDALADLGWSVQRSTDDANAIDDRPGHECLASTTDPLRIRIVGGNNRGSNVERAIRSDRFSNTATLSLKRPQGYDLTTDEPAASRMLVQLDDWQAVDAERRRDLAAVVDVVLEDAPDDRLVRDGGPDDSGAA